MDKCKCLNEFKLFLDGTMIGPEHLVCSFCKSGPKKEELSTDNRVMGSQDSLGPSIHTDVALACTHYPSIVTDQVTHSKNGLQTVKHNKESGVLTWPLNSPDLNLILYSWAV